MVLKGAGWSDSPWHGDGISSATAAPHSSAGSEAHAQGGFSVSGCACSAWGGGKLPGHPRRPGGRSQCLRPSLCPCRPCREINT